MGTCKSKPREFSYYQVSDDPKEIVELLQFLQTCDNIAFSTVNVNYGINDEILAVEFEADGVPFGVCPGGYILYNEGSEAIFMVEEEYFDAFYTTDTVA